MSAENLEGRRKFLSIMATEHYLLLSSGTESIFMRRCYTAHQSWPDGLVPLIRLLQLPRLFLKCALPPE